MKSHTRKRLPHRLKSVKRKQLKQRGGLRSLFRRKSSKLKDLIMGKISANTRHSEVDLLDAYDKFSKAKSKYLQRYQEHRENLKIFDTKECNITWNNKNNAWFFVNFFPSNNYIHKSYKNCF